MLGSTVFLLWCSPAASVKSDVLALDLSDFAIGRCQRKREAHSTWFTLLDAVKTSPVEHPSPKVAEHPPVNVPGNHEANVLGDPSPLTRNGLRHEAEDVGQCFGDF